MILKEEILPYNKLFKTQEALKVLPNEITVKHWLSDKKAKIDIIINGYGNPELTNATVANYLAMEDKIPIKIIIVETSGDIKTLNNIKLHKDVSIVFTENLNISHPIYGSGSYGMAISSAIGAYFSNSKYLFFSHNDMLALKKDFLKTLLSKLNKKVRIASFTQRHFIPFTGCMLIDRDVITENKTDWLLYDKNPYIKSSVFLQNICNLKNKENANRLHCNWIDAGESFIYSEISNKKQVYISPSFGDGLGLWVNPFDAMEIPKEKIEEQFDSEKQILYANLKINKKEFLRKYFFVLRASHRWESFTWLLNKKKSFWRYCFDENMNLVFIHHGRGTRRGNRRWLKFAQEIINKIE